MIPGTLVRYSGPDIPPQAGGIARTIREGEFGQVKDHIIEANGQRLIEVHLDKGGWVYLPAADLEPLYQKGGRETY